MEPERRNRRPVVLTLVIVIAAAAGAAGVFAIGNANRRADRKLFRVWDAAVGPEIEALARFHSEIAPKERARPSRHTALRAGLEDARLVLLETPSPRFVRPGLAEALNWVRSLLATLTLLEEEQLRGVDRSDELKDARADAERSRRTAERALAELRDRYG